MKIPYVTNPVTEEEHGVIVTPHIASMWLANAAPNRHLMTSKIDAYARDMMNDVWPFQGDSIRFSDEGKLIDGRHRLTACIQSGSNFSCVVVVELPPERVLDLDGGAARTIAQTIGILGKKDTRLLTSSCTWYWKMNEGRWMLRKRSHGPTRKEVSEIILAHPEIERTLRWLKDFGQAGRMVQWYGIMTAIYCLVYKAHPDAAEVFFSQLFSGENCTPGAPALALRNKLAYARTKPHYSLDALEVINLVSHAWKSQVKNRTLRKIITRESLLALIGGPNWDKQDRLRLGGTR